MAKPLNICIIGYGFMSRAHSNAYCQVNHFFDTACNTSTTATRASSAADAGGAGCGVAVGAGGEMG